jgi:predicted Fe-Mo cluster-binding NifX family protein
MRIAITAKGHDLDASVDPRFGRASQFLLVETETMEYQVIGNTQSLDLPQGAGIQAAQTILNHHPDAVLTGNCGPKAFKVLGAAGVGVVLGVSGTAREAIQAFLAGQYKPAKAANVEGHW